MDIEKPDAALSPEVPAREDRKSVDAEVKDTKTVLKDLLDDTVNKFVDLLIVNGWDGETDDAQAVMPLFAGYADYILRTGNKDDYLKPEAYNLENTQKLAEGLGDGIPQPVLDEIIPKKGKGKE